MATPKYVGPGIVGEVEILPLASVRPNKWNPNVVPDHVMASIRRGLETDGWLAAQALLIWATDDEGTERNLIIDGEHRWIAGRDVGLKKAPMVRLRGLTEKTAKELTVKMNQRRGAWDDEKLDALLRELAGASRPEELALDLGFDDAKIAAAIGPDGAPTRPATRADLPSEIPESRYQTQFAVIITFADEGAQKTGYDALQALGYACRVAVT